MMFVARYILKHIRRLAAKAMLAVLLAALTLVAIGHLGMISHSYDDLFDKTEVKANIIGGFELNHLPPISDSGYVSETYYEGSASININAIPTTLIVTNNITRYTAGYAEVTYADGYDESCMDQVGEVLIIGSDVAIAAGVSLGGTVRIIRMGLFERQRDMFISRHRRENPDDGAADDELLALYFDEIMENINMQTHIFTVAGIAESSSGAYRGMVYAPGSYRAQNLLSPLEVVEFTVADNNTADEFRSFAEGRISSRVTFVLDTGRLENIRNSRRLIDMLYPMAVAAALLIGGFLCCLMTLKLSKEAAIMRVLGTTKFKTRFILTAEHSVLSIAGLIIGAGVMAAYTQQGIGVITGRVVLYGALYIAVIIFCGIISSYLATRRSALELLQVKE